MNTNQPLIIIQLTTSQLREIVREEMEASLGPQQKATPLVPLTLEAWAEQSGTPISRARRLAAKNEIPGGKSIKVGKFWYVEIIKKIP